MNYKVTYHAEDWSIPFCNGAEVMPPFEEDETVRLIGSTTYVNGRVAHVERGLTPRGTRYAIWWRGISDIPLWYYGDELRRASVREGDTIPCGEWCSVDEFIEGALPGRYEFVEVLPNGVAGNRLEVVVPS